MPDAPPPPIRVLHLEDDPRDAALVRDTLEADGVVCAIVHVESRARFESALAHGAFDLIICDFNLPDFDGLTALKLAKARFPDVPVIIVSGAIDPGEAVRCLKEGATDYLLKERLERLPSAVTRAIEDAEQRRQREQIDAKLRESEHRYRTLADSGQALIWSSDTDKQCDYFNRAWLVFTGRTMEQEAGDGWAEGVHPDDLQRCLATYVGAFDRREPFSMDYRLRRHDGEYRWIQDDGGPRYSASGEFIGYIGYCLDITERRQAEEARRQSEAFSRAVLDSLSAHLAVLDAAGTIVATNRAWSIFARDNGGSQCLMDATGTNYLSVVEKSVRDGDAIARAALDGIWAVLSGARETFLLEYPCHSPGKQRWFAMRVHPRSDGRDGVVVAHQDITERRDLESRFHQTQKMESLGRLTGGIAHDFNNLLTVINGSSELALRELGDLDALRADLNDIHRAGEQAAMLTRQLLAFSRQQILEPRVMNFNVAVAGMESLLRRLLGEDIDLIVVLTDGIANVKADPGQIEQVITNLAVNARDAMPHGGHLTIETQNVTIDESYARRDDVAVLPGPYVRLTVSDTGVGMDEATRARIFEPFFTTKDLGRGTGLGLATVYGIVKQSRGFIVVSSEVGRGTSFSINLPQAVEVADTDRPRPIVTSTSGTETILVAEDNEGLRKLARRVLEPAGYTVLEASTGEEALSALEQRQEPVHLLLSDVVLPGMGGRQLAERFALISSGTKVLYMSGYTDDTIMRHGVLDAQMPFLGKPFTAEHLLRKVREVLDS